MHPFTPDRVLVAGGGAAAAEALLALHALAGDRVRVDVLAREGALVQRHLAVAAPFGFGATPEVALDELARRTHGALRRGELAAVDGPRGRARTADGAELEFDHLLIAVGARPREAVPGALTFTGPAEAAAVTALVARAAAGELRRLVFAVPVGVTWALPLYELAIMAAMDLRNRAATGVAVEVVTPEARPLALFGDAAGDAVERLLGERGIGLQCGRHAVSAASGRLVLADGELPADAVVALPVQEGPRIAGLPCDEGGFLPVDVHGRVTGTERVLAAGDATSFPVKQGGLATQQADAAAQTIAFDAGAAAEPGRFHPVLRGLLLTGGAPTYLRSELSPAGGVERTGGTTGAHATLLSEVSQRALWWPPGKVAGRYLAPYLSTARPASVGDHPLEDRYARPAAPAPPAEDAYALALIMAQEDARMGDYRDAVAALDAAAALSGRTLPPELAAQRELWTRAPSA